jgi:hypothetical protein
MIKNLDSPHNRKIYDEKRTDADRLAEITDEQFGRLRQNALGFAKPTTAWEKTFKKIAPGLWEYWAIWKEL